MHLHGRVPGGALLLCVILMADAAPIAAGQQSSRVESAASPDEGQQRAEGAAAPQEGEKSALRRLVSQQFRVSTTLWPGNLGQGVDPFWGEVEYRPRVSGTGSRLSGAAEGLFRATTSGFAHLPEAGGLDDRRRGLQVQSDRQAALIKELSLSVDSPVDFVVGWQVVSWGHGTDGVQPLDVFQRHDVTDRLRPEQLGVAAVSASLGNEVWDAEAVWIPSSPTDRVATAPSNVWYPFPRSPAGGTLDAAGPAFDLINGEVGVRTTWHGRRADVAVMAARTRDRVPSMLELHDGPGGAIQVRSLYDPYWLVGASFVRIAGSYVLRAEALRATYSDSAGPLVTSGVRGVAGVERRFSSAGALYTVIAQYATDTTASERVRQEGENVSSPFRIYRHALTGSVAVSWRQQYELETRAMVELRAGSTIASAKFSYRASDHFTIWAAADLVTGRSGTWIERLDSADRILAGINVTP
jgi:hypothetical protein